MFRNKCAIFWTAGVIAVVGLGCAAGVGQQARQYTAEDYAAAERFMAYNVNPLAYKGVVRAQWLEDGRFWYRDTDASGATYVVVDPAKGTRAAAFDQDKLAAALKQQPAARKAGGA